MTEFEAKKAPTQIHAERQPSYSEAVYDPAW
jgi:hypothetical protein